MRNFGPKLTPHVGRSAKTNGQQFHPYIKSQSSIVKKNPLNCNKTSLTCLLCKEFFLQFAQPCKKLFDLISISVFAMRSI